MTTSKEEMDGIEEANMSRTQESPDFRNRILPSEPLHYSTKKEKLAQRGNRTPGIDYAPPRPPAKSAPPVSRVYTRMVTVGPSSVSFLKAPSLDSPHYDKKVKKTYFEQVYANHTKIGQGSFGEVFSATCKDDGKRFAIKKAHVDRSSYGRRSRVLDEVRKHEMLHEHPNIVKFYNAWEEDQVLYIKLELCKESLNQYSLRVHDISEGNIWTIFADLCFGVRHLHSHNLLHMDIKPENIFISFNGICKLGDLGLVVKESMAVACAEEGDGRYLALEAFNSNPGKPSDIFSLGMTILELAADLDVPLRGNLWHDLRNSLLPFDLLNEKKRSRELQFVIMWMLLYNFEHRPTVVNILQHPELCQKFRSREEMYSFKNRIQEKTNMPSLEDLAREREFLRPEETNHHNHHHHQQEEEGAVGGVAEGVSEDSLNVSASNDSRVSDEVDGLIHTCKEVMMRPLLPQESFLFAERQSRSEPLRRMHTNLMTPPDYFESPIRQVKMPRIMRNSHSQLATPAGDDDSDGSLSRELFSPNQDQLLPQQPEEGDRVCAPKNLMRLFNASEKYAKEEVEVIIRGYGDEKEEEEEEEEDSEQDMAVDDCSPSRGDMGPGPDQKKDPARQAKRLR